MKALFLLLFFPALLCGQSLSDTLDAGVQDYTYRYDSTYNRSTGVYDTFNRYYQGSHNDILIRVVSEEIDTLKVTALSILTYWTTDSTKASDSIWTVLPIRSVFTKLVPSSADSTLGDTLIHVDRLTYSHQGSPYYTQIFSVSMNIPEIHAWRIERYLAGYGRTHTLLFDIKRK